MSFLPSEYNKVLAFVALGLAVKHISLKLFVIRVRLANSLYNWPEDEPALKTFEPLLKMLMVAIPYDPKVAEDAIKRYNSAGINSAENEPYFLFAAAALSYLTKPPAYTVNILYAFLVLRVLHSIFLVFKVEPFRTFTYVPGLVLSILITFLALSSFK